MLQVIITIGVDSNDAKFKGMVKTIEKVTYNKVEYELGIMILENIGTMVKTFSPKTSTCTITEFDNPKPLNPPE